MLSLTFFNIIAMSIIFYLCFVAPSASGKIGQGAAGLSRYRTNASRTKLTKPAGAPKPAHDNPHNTSSTSAPRAAAIRRNKNKNRSTPRATPLRRNATKVRPGAGKRLAQLRAATPTKRRRQNEQPTPEPTGDASASTTVYVSGPNVFALLLPQNPGGGYPIYPVSARCDPFLCRRDGVRCRERRYCILYGIYGWKWVRKPFPKRVHHRGCVLVSAGWIIRPSGWTIRVTDRESGLVRSTDKLLFTSDNGLHGRHQVSVCGRR